MNASSSKQWLVSGACIAAYNLIMERLIAASKALINSSSNVHSSDTCTNKLNFHKMCKRSVFLCTVTYTCVSTHDQADDSPPLLKALCHL